MTGPKVGSISDMQGQSATCAVLCLSSLVVFSCCQNFQPMPMPIKSGSSVSLPTVAPLAADEIVVFM